MPIDKAEICTLIPHAGLMCLLDSVLKWDNESVVCTSETHRDPSNPLRRDGRLSALHAYEYGAQAAAGHGGLRGRGSGVVAPRCYPVALRDTHFRVARVAEIASRQQVRAERLF